MSMGVTGSSGPAATTGLFGGAGASAAREAARSGDEVRDLAGALQRSYRRALNFEAAAVSEPATAAELHPLTERGWRVLHDRRWPGSTRAKLGTIHRAKGLDFAAVYLADLSAPTDSEASTWEQLRAQREYVACTRPRDRLWIGRYRPEPRHGHRSPTG